MLTLPLISAWHGYKYIDPKESGAVIPIVHVNGFKISERTIYGCMDNKELVALFTGYGYQCRFVEDLEDIDADLGNSLEWALKEINRIQQAARSGKPIMKPRWPVIIMRTPKGWSGPKKVDGEFIEGSFHSHQVPLPKAKTDKGQLRDLVSWLTSYRINDLLTEEGGPTGRVTSIIPEKDSRKLGQVKETYDPYEGVNIPDWQKFGLKKGDEISCMVAIGELLDQALVDNPKTLRVFSPDEFVSNKLDAAFRHTNRNFQWDEFSNARGGRVIEILSEHCCQGFLQGYTLTGRVGLFPSYESFLGIIHTMMVQFSKFGKMVSVQRRVRNPGLLTAAGARDNMEKTFGLHQLHRDKHVGEARAQWLLSPEPIFYRRRLESQTTSRARLPPARCKHFSVDSCSLPPL